jgi:hypothetical protein
MHGECGLFTMVDHGADKPLLEIPTTQCCHCDRHFPIPKFFAAFVDGMVKLIATDFGPEARESRIGRGWCPNHGANGYICSAACAECIDREKKRGILEGIIDPTAVSVAVPAGISILLPHQYSPA